MSEPATTTTQRQWHEVQPLPLAVQAALTAAVRKLSHDVSNSLVAAVSYLDLLGLQAPLLRDVPEWRDCRHQLDRPRQVMKTALWCLPAGGRGQPQTLPELSEWWETRVGTLGLTTTLPVLPAQWARPEAVFALCCVLTNAVEALEEARRLGEPLVRPPTVGVRVNGHDVLVEDSGPGCSDPAAAASGQARRAGQGHLGVGLASAAAALAPLGGGLAIAAQPWGNSPAAVAPNHGFVARLTLPPLAS